MKKIALAVSAIALMGATAANAATYNVTTTWLEPQTQPRDSIFTGTFDYDAASHTITNLKGLLSESMTDTNGMPLDAAHMVWLTLSNQLVSWYDATLGGTFAATFKNTNTKTFYNPGGAGEHPVTADGGDFWSPQVGADVGGIYYGFPTARNNPGNAYALIFVPDNPLTALTQAQINKLAYADCVPTAAGGMMMGGGMMGAVCMTGTSIAGYGVAGTMDGYPVSQTITAAVPEPETYAMMMAGLGLIGFMNRRRKPGAAAVATA
jgi:hypothetical protein